MPKLMTLRRRSPYTQHARRVTISFLILFALVGAMLPATTSPVSADSNVPVRYDALQKIIYVGANYRSDNPAEAPYVHYPSHPNAPKSAITIPQVAAALHDPTLLQQTSTGIWLLKADLVISQTARLEASKPSITALRLDSTTGARYPAYTRLVARGGQLLIQDIAVSSWDHNHVDTNYYDGRSYLLAELGGRMDIIRSEVSYLGWGDGEPSGLAWRERGNAADPLTGSTGSILNSNIHHNYFGQYSYAAYGLKVTNNEFHHNVYYGFDPHDASTGFEVAYNKVHDNGKHGIIFSRDCTLNWIHNNEVYDNAEHGIFLDRGSHDNQISDNLVYNNRDGIAIFQSSNNVIQNNVLRDNERGIRINATFDSNDRYDGLANENKVVNNTIQDNSQYGVYLYERADQNVIANNTISGNTISGIYLKTGGNTIKSNAIRDNGKGVSIIGGPASTGGLPPTYLPGVKNALKSNTIEDNATAGISLSGAAIRSSAQKRPGPLH